LLRSYIVIDVKSVYVPFVSEFLNLWLAPFLADIAEGGVILALESRQLTNKSLASKSRFYLASYASKALLASIVHRPQHPKADIEAREFSNKTFLLSTKRK
jgi:hypothetical protein